MNNRELTKFMTGHRQTLLKVKPYSFTSCFNKANGRAKID